MVTTKTRSADFSKKPSDRLKEVRTEQGFRSARGAAIEMGWHPTTYASHENGARRLTRDAAERYAAGFGCDWAWLMYGEDAQRIRSSGIRLFTAHRAKALPLFSHGDAAAYKKYSTEPPERKAQHVSDRYTINDTSVELSEDAFAFEIQCDCMTSKPPVLGELSFNPGDVVIVDPAEEMKPGHFVVADIGRELVLRKLRGIGADQALVPLNSDYPETLTSKARLLGRAVRSVQKI